LTTTAQSAIPTVAASHNPRLPAALGLTATLLVLITLGAPGITSDEPLDTRVGRGYVQAAISPVRGLTPLSPSLYEGSAQHPPLGRWLVGIASTAFEPFESLLGGADPFGVHAARIAPALAFGVLVWVVARAASRRWGSAAGLAAALSCVFQPRLFAHGHFATLDTFLSLFWVASVVAVESATRSRIPPRAMILAGLVWGLALLTKIHAWLLPPLVLLWCLWRLGWKRGPLAFAIWIVVGLLVFLAGWPWLWEHTGTRLAGFLGTSVDRLALRVQYFGTVYLDKDVPWHYPWFYFLATIPVGVQLATVVGVAMSLRDLRRDAGPPLWLGAILLLLVVFSTNAPVYDGERLFLPAFFLAAIFAGRGFGGVWTWAGNLPRPRRRLPRWILGLTLAAQGWGLLTTFPFGLSYHNALVGGLRGAERLGLELTYWGDSIDGTLLRELERVAKPGDSIVLAPSLHDAMPVSLITPDLARQGLRIEAESSTPIDSATWVLIFRREAYWSPAVRELTGMRRPFALRARQGVWLGGLWAGPWPPIKPTPTPPPDTTSKSQD
jgi:4-amino-4-deoxy-L-arabinose transferase-like glycosyltransferase